MDAITNTGAAGMLSAEDRFYSSARRVADGQTKNFPAEVVEQSEASLALEACTAVVRSADQMSRALLDLRT